MAEIVLVVANGVTFYAEVADTDGPSNVGLDEILSFDGVRQTIEAISIELVQAWQVVRPDQASVDFSLMLKAQEGKLTGLLVSAGAQASLKITLTWQNPQNVTGAASVPPQQVARG